jgi:peptidyl-prolyl cis-trans isomerase SurA
MSELIPALRTALVVAALSICLAHGSAAAQVQIRGDSFSGDYIAAVVNNDLVTAGEIDQRVERAQLAAQRAGQRLPPPQVLRQQVLDSLIEERVLITTARQSGAKVEDSELDRAAQAVAAQNKWTLEQLRERLRQEGIDYSRFRANLRDQMLVERVREREVGQRTQVSELEVDDYLASQNASRAKTAELNIAQILISVPEGADAQTAAQRKARADAALERALAGENFAALASELSDDANKAQGGELGLRVPSRLPDAFVAEVDPLAVGQVAPKLLRTGAGWHVLKLIDRQETTGFKVTQTQVRHILLRPSAQLSTEAAARRMVDYRSQIVSGASTFEAMAKQYSEDGSAPQGGDLGWVSPGNLVPEFEQAMNALSIGGISQPVVSRFGVHLIKVEDRRESTVDAKQVRAQARNVLRERKFEEAYNEWLKELRAQAYVEMREPPQ